MDVTSGEEIANSAISPEQQLRNGSRSNYADKPGVDGSVLTEHRLRFGDENRAYTPTSGESDLAGHFGGLADGATGDWCWKPQRYKADPGVTLPYDANTRGAELEAQMPTFHGVPPSPAELYRGQVFTRA